MEHTSQSHRNIVNNYFKSNFIKPIKLSNVEVDQSNAILTRSLMEVGNLNWLTRIFIHSLDVYWSKTNASKEYALRHEGMISDYMRQVVMARQFSRFSPIANSSQIEYDSVTITEFDRFWHPYYDQDLPKNIDSFMEPYRTMYTLLKYLSIQLLETASSEDAMKFMGSLSGAFALSYPAKYLETDLYFQQYHDNEVQGVILDDDYTFYLCRMTDYSLFNRS